MTSPVCLPACISLACPLWATPRSVPRTLSPQQLYYPTLYQLQSPMDWTLHTNPGNLPLVLTSAVISFPQCRLSSSRGTTLSFGHNEEFSPAYLPSESQELLAFTFLVSFYLCLRRSPIFYHCHHRSQFAGLTIPHLPSHRVETAFSASSWIPSLFDNSL